jgi:hypothetical protein
VQVVFSASAGRRSGSGVAGGLAVAALVGAGAGVYRMRSRRQREWVLRHLAATPGAAPIETLLTIDDETVGPALMRIGSAPDVVARFLQERG